MAPAPTRGIYAAVVTPVDNKGVISVERYTRHARWLLRHGCHGLGVFGTTSETQAFSVAERQQTLDDYIAGGLPPEKMIVGIGCCACADTVALARHALGHGITRLLCLPPFFYKSNSDEGLIRAFSEVIERTADPRLELLLYHFPQVSGVPVTKGVIAGLMKRHPGVLRGIKDSSGDLAHTKDLIASFPDLAIFAGADGHLLEVLKAGGAGTISAAGNLNCHANRQVFDAFERGDLEAAAAGMKLVASVREVLQRHPLIPSIKHVIGKARSDATWATMRPPLVELDAATAGRLEAELDATGFVYDPDLYSVAGA